MAKKREKIKGVKIERPKRAKLSAKESLKRLQEFAQRNQRFVRLFETVGSNPNNRRPDAVQAAMITQQAANAGVEAYTRLMQNGEQIWVFVRNSIIINAGMNPPGAIR